MLDHAVFAAVKADDRQHPTGGQPLSAQLKRGLELGAFAVDFAAQGLEDTRRTVGLAVGADDAFDQVGQEQRAANRRAAARSEDCGGHGARLALVAFIKEEVGEVRLTPRVHDVSRRQLAAAIHAHVKLGVGAKRKTARALVEVQTRYAQVKQHPRGTPFERVVAGFEQSVELRDARAAQRHAVPVRRQARARDRQHLVILIGAQQAKVFA